MDASQYKDYVLIILFVKYLSDKAKQNDTDIKVPNGCFFDDFVSLKQDSHIGEEINKKLEAIKEANAKILGSLVLPNFNDSNKFGQGKTMIETLSKLIGVFENESLDFSKNRAKDDDLLGDAYEYLMKNFAAESGKSKGQFYTPAEVSRVIAKVLPLDESRRASDSIYDPTCGSGSLLLRAIAETARGNASLFGQEKDSTTASLAKLNMLLHGVSTAEIAVGDTLNDPKYREAGKLKTFDYCIANPPFSQKNWLNGEGQNDLFNRWKENFLPPAKNGDYAFLLHLISSMKPNTGCGACILPHGVLFRGNAEGVIREHLIRQKVLVGIIGLPPNIFFGTGIPASIIILDNHRNTEGIFFIDASKGFLKDGNKNRLREQDIRKIVDTYRNRLDIPHYSRFVSFEEIERNGFNLNIPRYIEAENSEETQDIDGHLNGGISKDELDALGYWTSFEGLRKKLFKTLRKGYSILTKPEEVVFDTIINDSSVKARRQEILEFQSEWETKVTDMLIKPGSNARTLIESLASLMIEVYADRCIIDKYDAYGVLMNYLLEVMQDDLYAICADGWQAARAIEITKQTKTKKEWDGLLIPKILLERKLYPDDLDVLARLSEESEKVQSQIDSYVEELSESEDDPLSEIKDDDEIVSDTECKKRIKVLRS
ncbi:MAG: type I restriction-modification system subunit M, partial [Planctomycetia bacterium]|nr:type I restriction-modification system subunit M [Planctomycetia bacterium]